MSIPKTCLHVMSDGDLCQAMALKSSIYCHFHARNYVHDKRPSEPDYQFPVLEDTRSVIFGIRDTIDAFMRKKITQKEANTLLYAYQITMSGVGRRDGMSPTALRELEKREAVQLAVRLAAKSASGKRKETPEDGDEEPTSGKPGFADLLASTLSELSGVPIDLERKDLPPEQRPSKNELLIQALESLKVEDPVDKAG